MNDLLAEADAAAAAAASAAGVVIRHLESMNELDRANALFDEIWQPHDGPSVRIDLLRALTKAGNYVTGAYDAAHGEMLGACMGFFGPPSHAELHSHITGVVQAGLRRSVGFALKVHQRAWALRAGAESIAWTYDPLIRRNAYFNMVKLGARPAEYLRNFYGTMDDAINAGTETDRILIRWELRSELAVAASAGKVAPASFAAEVARGAAVALTAREDGWPAAVPDAEMAAHHAASRRLLVAVPEDAERLREANPACAAAWRSALRDALAPAMAAGGRVTGFDRDGWYVVSAGSAGHAGSAGNTAKEVST